MSEMSTIGKGKKEMIKIGLTGGISSGKSTVSEYLNQKYGVTIIDADRIGYEIAEPHKELWEEYVKRYGSDKVLLADGTLNRRAVANIVFSSAEEQKWMDSVAIPLIEDKVSRQIKEYEKKGEKAVIIDAPLLFEKGWEYMADSIWVVYVNPETQLKRLMKRNNYDEKTAEMRIASQMSLEIKKEKADVVIDNSGTLEEARKQVDEAWAKIN